MNTDINVLTYPRSGVTLFKDLADQHGFWLNSFHRHSDLPNIRRVCSIIRQPEYSVASHYAMGRHHGISNDPKMVDWMLEEYISLNSWILENAKYIILYDDLINNTEKTMMNFLESYGLRYQRVDYKFDRIPDNPSEFHLKSSSDSEHYVPGLHLAQDSLLFPEANRVYESFINRLT